MKNKSTIVIWLFRPFTYIAGVKALLAGIAVMALISILGYLSYTHFDGIIDIHLNCLSSPTPYIIHAFYQLSTLIILTAVFYITARVASKSETRLIDIAGTMALSQAPLIIAALLGFIPSFHVCIESLNTDIITVLQANIIPVMISAVVFMIFSIWSIILKYNAYSVSANLKGAKAWISFAVALLICEIISKIVLYQIVPLIK
ncbi:hypothetical protein M2451_001329 [Dysgonomonas sp. PFB1-18]|uniref:YIP1 family protein n=1 Tax=unclassified Dysgonomonas TaxID=2630389 RepID=UPI00247617F9|nr:MULTISPECIES: YIP1 family protein [unclassified Dysgonomonas]MDH6308763.1 hypothetical protein [Dysgonomonas sp. PF1-14]MDH6338540.1 hypothetical protein [Dysgonomonas sp. PF1-16]MDH6380012.1 hypothetical protein [Dysgonomonas sp. PFB1-18]MDH6397368.1 hypothetical protein [Dysgonomonas sp. PF1-23]